MSYLTPVITIDQPRPGYWIAECDDRLGTGRTKQDAVETLLSCSPIDDIANYQIKRKPSRKELMYSS